MPASGSSLVVASALPKDQSTPVRPLTARWLDLMTFSHSQRYRNQYDQAGNHYFENGQERSLIAGTIKLDPDAKYSIGFRASSGRSFNWAFADYVGGSVSKRLSDPALEASYQDPSDAAEATAYINDPAGVAFINNVNSGGWEFFVRELYVSATPTKAATVQFGSFAIEKGYSTEITSFDDDGYIAGERVILHDPMHLWFDQVTLTSAYFGYFEDPNLFDRGKSFTKSNYRQLAMKKQLTPRVGLSGEYNWISQGGRTHTTREAVVIGTQESKIFDKVRFEGYDRWNTVFQQGDEQDPGHGFAVVAEKKVGRLSGDFGYASIDPDYGVYIGHSFVDEVGFDLNGDNYNSGNRIFSHLSYKINPVVTAFGFYTHILGADQLTINFQGLNAGLSFDLKALVNTEKTVF